MFSLLTARCALSSLPAQRFHTPSPCSWTGVPQIPVTWGRNLVRFPAVRTPGSPEKAFWRPDHAALGGNLGGGHEISCGTQG